MEGLFTGGSMSEAELSQQPAAHGGAPVNIHKNARLTPAGRALMLQRVAAGEPARQVAASLGISVRTLYKWQARRRAEGGAGLLDRSSRPHRIPRRISRAKRRAIKQLRERRWSTPAIAERTGIPISTVVDEVRRLGLSRLPALNPPPPVIRYERQRPGELIHLDIKKLGRFVRAGHRVHGNRRLASPGVGWEYYHVCIDDATRTAYGEILSDEKGDTVAGFLRRAARWFADQGVAIERVMTDNGSGYISRAFRVAVRELGARHIRTRPYTPRTNGKAERFIRTSLEQWAYKRSYRSSTERAAALPTFLTWYNRVRRHSAIGNQTPQQRLLELREHHNVSVNHS